MDIWYSYKLVSRHLYVNWRSRNNYQSVWLMPTGDLTFFNILFWYSLQYRYICKTILLWWFFHRNIHSMDMFILYDNFYIDVVYLNGNLRFILNYYSIFLYFKYFFTPPPPPPYTYTNFKNRIKIHAGILYYYIAIYGYYIPTWYLCKIIVYILGLTL